MRKTGVMFFAFLTSLSLRCTDATQIGANFIRDDNLRTFMVDTVSMKAATVYLDSTSTNATTRLLVGDHVDEKLGRITAQPYFTFKTNTGSELKDIKVRYVKTTLLLVYDKYSYYDTLKNMRLSVHRVTKEIKPNEEDGRYYNTMRFAFEPTPLADTTFRAFPKLRDTLEIKLNHTFGKDVFDKALAQKEELKTDDDFVKYLKGLTLRSENTEGPFLGFGIKVELRIYYKNNSLVPEEEKILKFQISDTKFNHIRSDRKGTVLENLTDRLKAKTAAETRHTVYLQGGTPIGVRINFPYLKRILLDNPDLILAEAYLEIWPADGSERINTAFPTPSISMCFANSRNELRQPDQGWSNSAGLKNDPLYGKDFYYWANIKSYISQELSTGETGEALFLLPSNTDITSSVNRLYLNAGKTNRTLKLKLYFITPKL